MNETYSDQFVKSLKKFASIKKRAVNKIDKIIQNPQTGEPLKYDLRGLYSAPLAKNFLIIYSYCNGLDIRIYRIGSGYLYDICIVTTVI